MTATTDERLSDLRDMPNPEGGDKHIFAELTILDAWDCVLMKGQGKVPFSPAIHRPEQRRVNVVIELQAERKDGTTYALKQEDINNGSKSKITLASLEDLGVETLSQLRALNGAGKWAEVMRVPTGQKYAAKKDSADGSIKAGDMIAEQALKFLRLFPGRDEAKAAEVEFYTPRNGEGSKNAPQPVTAAELGSNPQIDEAARESLLKTLPVLWQAAQQNESVFASFLTNNPGYAAAGLTLASDDVQRAIGKIPF